MLSIKLIEKMKSKGAQLKDHKNTAGSRSLVNSSKGASAAPFKHELTFEFTPRSV